MWTWTNAEFEAIIAERDEARRLLAQSEGHNLLLQDTVNQLQAALEAKYPSARAQNEIWSATYHAPPRAGDPVPQTGSQYNAPAHLDFEREGANAATMSHDNDE